MSEAKTKNDSSIIDIKKLLTDASHNIFLAEQTLQHNPNRQYLFRIRIELNDAINLLCRD